MESFILVIKWITKTAFTESNKLLKRFFLNRNDKHWVFKPEKLTKLPPNFQLFWGKEGFRIKMTVQKSSENHCLDCDSHLSLNKC